MIDVTKPLELIDGRKATFVQVASDGDITVNVVGEVGTRDFNPISGVHWARSLPNLRNVPEEPWASAPSFCLIKHDALAPRYDHDPRNEKWCDCANCYTVLRTPAPEPQLDPTLSLPDDDALRGEFPMADGLLDYFPNALAEVSKVSKVGNDQHNPGEPMHWARDKSTDHQNKIMRHLVDRGKLDGRGIRHTARLAWRALAMLQAELEAAGVCPPSRASR